MAEALERELKQLGVEESALGAGALALAARLDDPSTSAAAAASAQRELRETLGVLVAVAADDGTDRMTKYETGLRVAS